MKKTFFVLTILFSFLTMTTFAQNKTELGGGLAITSGNGSTLAGINLRAQHAFNKNMRVAGNFNYYFPKNEVGFIQDLKVNAFSIAPDFHYVFPIGEEVEVYALAGLSIFVASAKFAGERTSATAFGGAIGGGAAYQFSNRLSGFVEPKIMFAEGGSGFGLNLGVLFDL